MRISDWSSDVALPICHRHQPFVEQVLGHHARPLAQADPQRRDDLRLAAEVDHRFGRLQADLDLRMRGEEAAQPRHQPGRGHRRSEEHTSELQSLMRISYAVFCLKKKIKRKYTPPTAIEQ